MQPWANFYNLTGTAAATLAGLMFIAVTFGSKLITPETVRLARRLLTPIIYHFGQAFLIACAASAPGADHWVGLAAICTSAWRLLTIPIVIHEMKTANAKNGDFDWTDWLLSVVLPTFLYLIILVTGCAFLRGSAWSHEAMAASVLGLLALGLITAWDMVMWIASQLE